MKKINQNMIVDVQNDETCLIDLLVKRGDKNLCKVQISFGAEDSQDLDADLISAVIECDAAPQVKYLLDQGANPNATEGQGIRALTIACANNDLETACELIKHGAEVTFLDAEGISPLYYAASHGNEEMVNCLLQHGVHPDDGARNSLLGAIESGNIEVVAALVHNGADVDRVDNFELAITTPLSFAVMFAKIQLVEFLLDHGADINFIITEEDGISQTVLDIAQNLYGFMDKEKKNLLSPLRMMIPAEEARDGKEIIELLVSRGAKPVVEIMNKSSRRNNKKAA